MVTEATATITLSGGVSETINDISYMFDIISKDRIEMPVDVTDHFVEDNTAIQDHVAIPPNIFTLQGFIGEKVFETSQKYTEKIAEQVNKLSPIGALLPVVSNYANLVISTASYIENSAKRYYEIYKKFKDKTPPKNKQKAVCEALNEFKENRSLMELTSPYGHFENLLITYADIVQNETKTQSELVCTLKPLRFAESQTVLVDKNKYADRVAKQKAREENLGKIQGKKVDFASIAYHSVYGW